MYSVVILHSLTTESAIAQYSAVQCSAVHSTSIEQYGSGTAGSALRE